MYHALCLLSVIKKQDIMKNNKLYFLMCTAHAIEFYDLMLFANFFGVFSNEYTSPELRSNKDYFFWLMFSLAFFARPLGGIFFGLIGDVYSRKKTLILSMTGMGVATLGIGILPPFSFIGIGSTILLIIFRFIQGFCIGGETNGFAIYCIERLKLHPQILGSILLCSTFIGAVFAIVISNIIVSIGIEYWRYSFILGSILSFLIVFLRNQILSKEKHEKHNNIKSNKLPNSLSMPLKYIYRYHKLDFITIVFLSGINGMLCYFLTAFMPYYIANYLTLDGFYNKNFALFILLFAILYLLFLIRYGGKNATNFHKIILGQAKSLFSAGIILCIFIIVIERYQNTYFLAVISILLGITLANIGRYLYYFSSKVFRVDCRYTGSSLAFNLGMSILGSTTPLLCTYIVNYTKNLNLFGVVFISFVLIINIFLYSLKLNNVSLNLKSRDLGSQEGSER